MRRFSIALAALLVAGSSPARAEYPDRAIQIVVPYTPAGTVDLLARALAPRLTAAWGQPVVIVNRPGAGGSVGAEFVAKSAPDGYTVFISTNSPLTTNLALYPSLGYEPLRDFEPVILAGENSLVLAANPQLPVKTVKELIALAKTKPGGVSYASVGPASLAHLAGALLSQMAGVKLTEVPYRTSAQSVLDTETGRIDMQFGTMAPVLPHVLAGKVKAIAVTSLKRAAVLPDVPTLDESGLPGFEASLWLAVVAPAKTPPEIVAWLEQETLKVLGTPEMKEKLYQTGFQVRPKGAKDAWTRVTKEIEMFKQIIDQAGIPKL